jgi:hypothetical protein
MLCWAKSDLSEVRHRAHEVGSERTNESLREPARFRVLALGVQHNSHPCGVSAASSPPIDIDGLGAVDRR